MGLFGKKLSKQKKQGGKESPRVQTLRNYDREERIALQKMVTTIPVTRKLLSKELLSTAIVNFITKNVRMGANAANVVNNTTNPRLFFMNLQLVEDCTKRVVALEPYWKFEGKQPSDQLAEIIENKHDIIGAFIERSFYATVDNIKKKHNPGTKQKLFDEYQTNLLAFQELIDEDNQLFFKELCENCKELHP